MNTAKWWVVGDIAGDEFRWGPLEAMRSTVGRVTWDEARRADADWLSEVATTENVGGVVFWTPRPGLLDQRIVEAWNVAAPLARCIQVVGPWCDGEMRTGFPVDGMERVRWTEWRQLNADWLAPRNWRPRTWNSVEQWLSESIRRARTRKLSLATAPRPSASEPSAWIVIEAQDRETFEALSALVGEVGLEACWVRGESVWHESDSGFSFERVVGWIRDEAGCGPAGVTDAAIASLTSERLRLVNYPRVEDLNGPPDDPSVESLQRMVNETVLGKPFSIDRVLDWLKRCADSRVTE